MIKFLVCLLRFWRERRKPVLYKIGNLKRQNARIDGMTPMLIEIGDEFVSAPGSIILSHDASTFIRTGKYRVEKTVIGNRVFLGANAVILPGVKIEDNVIIGAGSVVTKNVASNMVVAGNPAKVICTVDEYIERCKQKNCLYSPPLEFEVLLQDGRPSLNAKIRFQKEILSKIEIRN